MTTMITDSTASFRYQDVPNGGYFRFLRIT